MSIFKKLFGSKSVDEPDQGVFQKPRDRRYSPGFPLPRLSVLLSRCLSDLHRSLGLSRRVRD